MMKAKIIKVSKLVVFTILTTIIAFSCEKEDFGDNDIKTQEQDKQDETEIIQVPTRINTPSEYKVDEVETKVYTEDSLILSVTNYAQDYFYLVFTDKDILKMFDEHRLTFKYKLKLSLDSLSYQASATMSGVNLSDDWRKHELQISLNTTDLKLAQSETGTINGGAEESDQEEDGVNVVIDENDLIQKDRILTLELPVSLDIPSGYRLKTAKLTVKSLDNQTLTSISGSGTQMSLLVLDSISVNTCLGSQTILKVAMTLTKGDDEYETSTERGISPSEWEERYDIRLPGQ